MKRIPAYLTDEEIARKITECVSSATGNDSQEHNRKIRTHIALRRLYGILLIRRYVRLSIMKNARRMLLHVDHGKWLLYTAKRMAAFILL